MADAPADDGSDSGPPIGDVGPTASQLQGAAPQNTSRFPDSEIAVLSVNNDNFQDWESIWLQWRWGDSFAHFRFIAAERTPPSSWPLLQFKPGDKCMVWLAQQPAMVGYITDRQTSYDAERHQVQLIGKSATHWGYKSSVDNPETGNSFDNKTLEQIFEQVLAKYPSGERKIIGIVNPLPFDKMQAETGELTWDFLERLAKIRGNTLAADNLGNYLLIGTHAYPILAYLKEGENILACECIISHDQFTQALDARGHTAGDDQTNSSAANEMRCVVAGKAEVISKLVVALETTVKTKAEVCDRAYNEAKWIAGTEIVANIIVYGWTYDGHQLWAPGMNVMVDTPMAMLNMMMKVRTVTFEQNNQSGTTTTLEVVAPWVFDDNGGGLNPGNNAGTPLAPEQNPEGSPQEPVVPQST